MRSSSLREARRAGLNTTISQLWQSDMAAQNMLTEKVLPKRRGVLMRISEGHAVHELRRMISGAAVDQSALYRTLAHARV